MNCFMMNKKLFNIWQEKKFISTMRIAKNKLILQDKKINQILARGKIFEKSIAM